MIVITGGAGFIGSNLARHLNTLGHEDLLLVDMIGTSPKWENIADVRLMDYRGIDEFLNLIRTPGALDDVEVVVNLGAITDPFEQDLDKLMSHNTHFAREIIARVAGRGRRMIHVSTSATYGLHEHGTAPDPTRLNQLRPRSRYAFSKHQVDRWIQRNNLWPKVTVLKPFQVYGPYETHLEGMPSLPLLCYRDIRQTGQLTLPCEPCPQLDLIHVADVCRIISWFIERPSRTGLFNVGTGRTTSTQQVGQHIFDALGRPPVLNTQARNEPAAPRAWLPADIANLAAIEFPVETIMSVADGIPAYVAWLQEHDRP